MKKKIYSLKNLSKIVQRLRKKNKKISLCHGVFDLLHPGHINHINQAKKISDILIVSLTADDKIFKGPGRPHFNETHRMNSIASLENVDFVVLSNQLSAVGVIKKVKPDFYVKGSDYKNFKDDITGKIDFEDSEVKKYGGKTIFTTGITFSSSTILNEKFIYNEEQYNFIKTLKNKYGVEYLLKSLNKTFNNTPLVIGESIIDEYVFCQAIGKSGKEPYMVLQEKKSEKYLGGVLSIAQNLAAFCKKVHLLSMIGTYRSYEDKIYNNLKENIKYQFIKKRNSPTILKKRFIEEVDNIKLLGVYSINDNSLLQDEERALVNKLKKLTKNTDLLIMSDYGHGLFTKKFIQNIYKTKKFLAVNVQVNSFSMGYHTITNYKKADLVLMNETELRQELKDKRSDRLNLIKKLEKKIKCKYIAITHGKTGATIYNTKLKKRIHVPAFARTVVDKVGAGDALFPILATSLKSSIPADISLYFASISAAINSENYASKFVLNKILFKKIIEHSIK